MIQIKVKIRTDPRPGRRSETVKASELLAHGQIASGRRPFAWNTLKNWSQLESDHGLAPSATNNIRSDDNEISL